MLISFEDEGAFFPHAFLALDSKILYARRQKFMAVLN